MLWIRMTLADDGWGSNISYELLAIILALVAMSALGQKQTFAVQNAMSASPPIATSHATCERSALTPPAQISLARCAADPPSQICMKNPRVWVFNSSSSLAKAKDRYWHVGSNTIAGGFDVHSWSHGFNGLTLLACSKSEPARSAN